MFEFNEDERMGDVSHVRHITDAYRTGGFYCSHQRFRSWLREFRTARRSAPDMLRLDMALIRGIDGSPARQIIVGGLVQMADSVGVRCIAQGIETAVSVA